MFHHMYQTINFKPSNYFYINIQNRCLFNINFYREPSIKEREEFEAACEKLNIAQKMLGQSHGIMVLGLGMESEHHMSCGK